MCCFRAQNGPFDLKKNFGVQTIIITFIYLGPFSQMTIFSENLLISFVPFIHAYLHAKNQSQILIY